MSREDTIRGLQEKFRQAGPSLNELERRLWAAREARELGRGGLTIVSQALRMSPNTVKRGMQELEASRPGRDAATELRIRKSGGGRKPKTS
jgi:hypothetical protein